MFQDWLNSVLGQKLDDGQCVWVPVSWAKTLNPSVEPFGGLTSVVGAKDWAGLSNEQFDWIENNHSDPNQLPLQGDIMVFGATPEEGYSNTFNNPYGHAGVCDAATPNGYTLVQQNAPGSLQPTNVTTYPWKFRPCLGWLHPKTAAAVPEYYDVVEGDTLSGIAEKFGESLSTIEGLNPQITNPDLITVGEHVRVK